MNEEQKRLCDLLLTEKDTLLQKRRYNRNQLDKLRIWYKTETDMDTRRRIRKEIGEGLKIVAQQTKELSALSMPKIAEKLETTLCSVVYYATSSYEVRIE